MVNSMAREAVATANIILDIADKHEIGLTPMAIQKILYFAHGWQLARSGNPLIEETFEAWDHGPVLPTVYAAFKRAGRRPIKFRGEQIDLATGEITVASEDWTEEEIKFLQDILKAYGGLDALILSDLTHKRGGPWHKVWTGARERIILGMRIDNADIKAYFLSPSRNLDS